MSMASSESIRELVEQLKNAKPLQSPALAAEIARVVAAASLSGELRRQVAAAASALNETAAQVLRNAPEIEKAVADLRSPEVERAIEAASKNQPADLRPALEAIDQIRRSGVLSQAEEYGRRAAEIVRLIGDFKEPL